MKITILGSGTSHGIPVIACACPVCQSADPKDSRYRASVYIELSTGNSILIDAGPEFRLQALRAGITNISALCITHTHADHLHGLDDLRVFTYAESLPVYAHERCIREIKTRFPYIFQGGHEGGGVPSFSFFDIGSMPGRPFQAAGASVMPIPVKHGSGDVLGFRIGDFAYLTDCSGIPATSLALLGGLGVLVIDGLRNRPHPTHFSIREAVEAAASIRPRKTYLTHLCHEVSHAQATELCRKYAAEAGMSEDAAEPSFDGLEIRDIAET